MGLVFICCVIQLDHRTLLYGFVLVCCVAQLDHRTLLYGVCFCLLRGSD